MDLDEEIFDKWKNTLRINHVPSNNVYFDHQQIKPIGS